MSAEWLRHEASRRLRNLRRDRVEGVGHDFIADVRNRLPHLGIRTIFDVGAHIGMTALVFGDEFPQATVYAFEPGRDNFERMKSNLVGKPETRFHRIGFSDQPSSAILLCEPEHPSMARIVTTSGDDCEAVELDTVDRFCERESISSIDFMKVDVEGHELKVLAGAERMLSEDRISLIKLESAIDPDIPYHVQLFDLCEALHSYGYRLFGFYDQWESTLEDGPKLRRFDVAFISPKTIRPRGGAFVGQWR